MTLARAADLLAKRRPLVRQLGGRRSYGAPVNVVPSLLGRVPRSESLCYFRFSSSLNNAAATASVTSQGGVSNPMGAHSHFSNTASTAAPVPTENVIARFDENEKEDSLNSDGEASSKVTKRSQTAAYLDLAKARLSALVVTTTAAGFIASGGPFIEQSATAASCLVGTALCSSSAAALNQIYERDRDARMKRTQKRPLVNGDLTVSQATTAAVTWGVAGTGLLAVGTDPITTALGASNIALYAGLYTYLKPRSTANTWVGAVVGAIPPVMGWTAATGGQILDMDAMILAATLYFWQLPHFFALSFMHRTDYARGGFAMVPVLESDGDRTSQLVVRNAWYLSTLPLVASATGVTSSMFALEGVVLNAYALHVAYQFRNDRTNAKARKVFLTSLWYLPCWLVLFLLHSKVWDEDNDVKNRDVLRESISCMVHEVRNRGRQLCAHEQVIAKQRNDDQDAADACPLTVGKRAGETALSSAKTSIPAAVDAAKTTTSSKNAEKA